MRSAPLIPLTLWCLCAGFSCMHDTGVPLVNRPPAINDLPSIAADTLRDTLKFFEQVICTTQVTDLNDSILWVALTPPFEFRQLDVTYDTKRIELQLPGSECGQFSGAFRVCDATLEACDTVQVSVVREFRDMLEIWKGRSYWQLLDQRDASYLQPWYNLASGAVDGAEFQLTNTRGEAGDTVGFRSAFRISGDFVFTIAYDLTDNVPDSFEVSMSIAADSVLDVFSEQAGIRLVPSAVGLEAVLYGGQRRPPDPRMGRGLVMFRREAGEVSIQHLPTLGGSYQVLGTNRIEASEVYFHASLVVSKQSMAKTCRWGGFALSKGFVVE